MKSARKQYQESQTTGSEVMPDASAQKLRITRLLLVAVAGVMSVVTWTMFKNWGYDDAHIPMRYAANFAAGKGLVFNEGERVLGAPEPLSMTILAAFGALGFAIPSVSNAVGIASIAACAIILYILFERRSMPYWGLGAAFLMLSFPHSYRSLGSAFPLFTALVLASFLAYTEGRSRLLTWTLAATSLARLEGAIVAVVVFLSEIKKRRAIPYRSILVYGTLVGAWGVFSLVYYGSLVTQDLVEKQQSARLLGSPFPFIIGAENWTILYLKQSTLNWLFIVLSILGILRIIVTDRAWLPLLAWAFLYLCLFLVLGLLGAHWYFTPFIPVLIICTVLGLNWTISLAASRLAKSTAGRASLIALSVLGIALLATGALVSLDAFRKETWETSRLDVYKQTAHWLAQNVKPGETVGMLETGIMGYYSNVRVVDFSGQLTPEVTAMRPQSRADAALRAVQRFKPDYVAIIPSWLSEFVSSDYFKANYAPVARFTHPDFLYDAVVVYQRARPS